MRRINFDWRSLAIILAGVIVAYLGIAFIGLFSYRCPDGRGIVVPSGKEKVPKICKQLKEDEEKERLNADH